MNIDKRLIALTFDDGPAETTKAIVDTLKKHNAKATFFVNGSCLIKYPLLTKYAFDIGCQIGNHTENHKNLTELSYQQIIEEINSTTVKIKAITGINPIIMRPPFGYYNDNVKKAAQVCKLPLINWNIDPNDWYSDEASTTRKRILAELDDGTVILCHDRMVSTSELMVDFIRELIENEYMLVTVSELFRIKKKHLESGVVYFGLTAELDK